MVMAVVSTINNHDVAEYGVRGALSLDVGAEGALADSKALHCLRERESVLIEYTCHGACA